MRRINYPPYGSQRQKFEKRYISLFTSTLLTEINCYLSNVKFNNENLTFEKLAVLSFEDLLKLSDKLRSFSKIYNISSRNEFTELFNYSNEHSKIARFFRNEKSLNFKTCFYCNIDYINSFKDIIDFKDGYEFLNNANVNELCLIYGLSDITAERIVNFRDTNKIDESNIDGLKLNQPVKKRILNLSIDNSHDHFTLDHFLPQNEYPFFALCLYNLVPSCYACNSKFKKALTLSEGDWQKVSPSSDLYSLDGDFQFRIRFDKSAKINSEKDILLSKRISNRDAQLYEDYLKLFKIEGRYREHKDQIFYLLKQKKRYDDEKIKSLSKKLKVSRVEIKRMVFGKELFESNNDDNSLIKFKKDIAKQLNIL